MKLVSTKSYVIVRAFVLLVRLNNAYAQEPDIDPAALRTSALKFPAPLPDKMPGEENDSTAPVTLGESLHFEKRLSRNESQSGGTGRPVGTGRAGTDNQPTSLSASGKRGTCNSPTTLDGGFQFTQFRNGRAAVARMQLGLDLNKEHEQELLPFLRCLTDKGIAADTAANEETAASLERSRIGSGHEL
jgi:cytochrome c peroxidase